MKHCTQGVGCPQKQWKVGLYRCMQDESTLRKGVDWAQKEWKIGLYRCMQDESTVHNAWDCPQSSGRQSRGNQIRSSFWNWEEAEDGLEEEAEVEERGRRGNAADEQGETRRKGAASRKLCVGMRWCRVGGKLGVRRCQPRVCLSGRRAGGGLGHNATMIAAACRPIPARLPATPGTPWPATPALASLCMHRTPDSGCLEGECRGWSWT
ncbi:hypothetical protein NDU88_006732 [Pleurodeles waltl]|uniref:Uncharacterized protein n=1 Tax=Pleurodeles waltl TaxID=8319 RepID=A0AAV7SQB9_PLEWA|nr:hypothetical protein NDU88_006732 [Pleurodeles waltl]